jgi:hypothetical protein
MTMTNRLEIAYNYFLDRLGEPTTWQGVAFIVSLFTAKYANLDWGQAAAVGGMVSAFIKTVTKG